MAKELQANREERGTQSNGGGGQETRLARVGYDDKYNAPYRRDGMGPPEGPGRVVSDSREAAAQRVGGRDDMEGRAEKKSRRGES